jgi:hypothetical protein
MSSDTARGTYRDFLERQMELWNRRLADVDSAAVDPSKTPILARLKAARSSLGQLLVRLSPDRSGVPDEIRAEAQSVLSELGKLWLAWEGKNG